jgi:hypothetical protein
MLLEILQKYKNMGAFGEETPFGIGELIYDGKLYGTKTPTFHFNEDLSGDGWGTVFSSPKSLTEVLSELITIIDSVAKSDNSAEFNKDLIALMKNELMEKEAEIEKNYSMVFWTNLQETEESPEVVGGKFLYDRKNGEEFHNYGSSEVLIDNPVLLEILRKYKELETYYSVSGLSNGYYRSDNELSPHEVLILTLPLYLEKDGNITQMNPPHVLNDVSSIVLEYFNLEKATKERCSSELRERNDDIIASYQSVIWVAQEICVTDLFNDGYEGYIVHSEKFEYNPNKGEEYIYIRQAGPGWDENVAEGFVFGERQIINGKIIVDFGFDDEDEEDDDDEYSEDE